MNGFDVFCNGFNAYCDEQSAQTVEEHKACTEAWRKMSPEEQAVYREKAKSEDYRGFNYYVNTMKGRYPNKTFAELASKWTTGGLDWRTSWEIPALEWHGCG